MSNRYKISFEEIAEVEPVQDESSVELNSQRLELELEQDSNEIERQGELAEGLEALRYIASKLDTPSPTEVALFKVAANMAVAGTTMKAQDFLPAMESNKPIALEGFGDKIKEIIKDIIAKLQEWWKKFKDFVKGLFIKEKRVEEKVEEVKDEIKENINKKAEPNSDKTTFTNDKYSKSESKNIQVFVDNLLLSKLDIKNNKTNLESINLTILQIKDLAGLSMFKIVPYYLEHCNKFLIKFESLIGECHRIHDYSTLSDSILEEIKYRHFLATDIISDQCKNYIDNDVSNDKPIFYYLNNLFSKVLVIDVNKDLDHTHFNLRVVADGGSDSFHEERAYTNQLINCENVTPNLENVFTNFNKDIMEKVNISINSDKIERFNNRINKIADMMLEDMDANSKSSVRTTLFINIQHVKQILNMRALLNNVQNFSSKCLDIYYSTLERKALLYRNLNNQYAKI
jgi:hypothetical protein